MLDGFISFQRVTISPSSSGFQPRVAEVTMSLQSLLFTQREPHRMLRRTDLPDPVESV
jgi:hypothetical protein